ncbi:MAG: hypothetical protein L3J59_14730 [Methylococcaceae bacterium]|nr:hypothetical protein [Methylococcaceae bacterium]
MNQQQKKNRRTIVLLFSMTIIPFCIAWYLSSNVDWIGSGTNNGKLIIPAITTERTELSGFDEFSKLNMKELKGHWVLVNVIPNKDCNDLCIDAIHKTKQLRLMMNKDLVRIRRVVLIFSEVKNDQAQIWWKDDLRLLRARPAPSLVQKLKEIRKAAIPEGMLFLMDPLGNLMMQYDPGFDPYKVKKDLGKLLRISQIG